MMRPGWRLFIIGTTLLGLSALLYAGHYFLFHDPHHIGIFLVGDIAFLPIEVLIVTLVLERLLVLRERQARHQKINMLIGAFFSEAGLDLLRLLAAADRKAVELRPKVKIDAAWTPRDFSLAAAEARLHRPDFAAGPSELRELESFFTGRRAFLLRLLESESLLEDETFTDCLWAVEHLAEELAYRPNLDNLPAADYAHLNADLQRAYLGLLREWVRYMRYLQQRYPFLFSLAVRLNPFDEAASVVIDDGA